MKIAVVHSFYAQNSPSGENIAVNLQVKALRNAGHEVELIGRQTDEQQHKFGYRLLSGLAAANLTGPDPTPSLERFKPDVIHVHNLFPNWGTRWTAQWSTKIVATLHNYRTICAAGTLWRDGHDCTECLTTSARAALTHRCYRGSALATAPLAWAARDQGVHSPILKNAQVLISLNTAMYETYRQLIPDKRIEILPNFAEELSMQSTSEPRGWVFIGRLTEEKGLSWLLVNWPREYALTIIGSGPLEDLARTYSLNEPDTFTFLGKQPHEHVRARLANAEGLVLPSKWAEGIPTVALEALQLGTPMAVSNACAASRELTAGDSGEIFSLEAGRAALRLAIQKIHNNPKMRTAAENNYRLRFSQARWLNAMTAVYTTLHSH